MYHWFYIVMSRSIPQTSVGRLVSLSVDNPKNYTHGRPASQSPPPPPLVSISAATSDDGEEKTMIWRNVATLFAKLDTIEGYIEKQSENTVRCTDEVYQDLQDVKADMVQLQTKIDENNGLSTHVRKLRKYVNKKCENLRESVSYSTYSADNEIFAYVDKTRVDFESRTEKMEDEITRLKTEMGQLNETYDNDCDMFIKREDDLMAKLEAAVKMNEATNNRMKDMEELFMKQIQQARNYADTHVAGDLREEFSTALCREVAYESKVSAQQIQMLNDELTGLISRSNDETNHRAKYAEDLLMKQIQYVRNYADTQVANILRVEYSGAICREADRVIEVSAQQIQSLNDELTGLITRSNEYHSMRYFWTVENVKQIRDTCQTLKESIGMVDAELSDTKETVEYLKDEVGQNTTDVSNITEDVNEIKDYIHRELDRDYYDLKDYVKHWIHRHEKHHHLQPASVAVAHEVQECDTEDPIQMIVEAYVDNEPIVAPTHNETIDDEHIILIDGNMVNSDDEDEDEDGYEFKHT